VQHATALAVLRFDGRVDLAEGAEFLPLPDGASRHDLCVAARVDEGVLFAGR
jgi:hypothetical protein